MRVQTSEYVVNMKILNAFKIQGSWRVEPEFETELCDLKIEGGNQGEHCKICWMIFIVFSPL